MMNVLSPCPAGLDPASHSVKQVGTQRVALDRDSMRLRVKPAKTQAHFDTPPLFFSTQQMVEVIIKKVMFSVIFTMGDQEDYGLFCASLQHIKTIS